MLQPGLYEQVINNALSSELSEIPEARKSTAPIDTAEASKVLAQYLTDVVQKGLEDVQDNGGGLEAQIQLANQIVNTIQNITQEADFASLGVDQRAEQLLALLRDNDPRLATGKSAKELERPETSLEESFQAYKEGVSLVQLCNEQIDRVEKEVRVLSQEGEADEQL